MPDHVQRDAASDGMARVKAQPDWKRREAGNTGDLKPEAARELTLAAAEIGRNDWAAPEPVTGIFSGRADAGTSSQEAIMKRIHHEDFTFYDHEQTSRRIPERDEREARDESRARRQGADREARPERPLPLRIDPPLQVMLHRLGSVSSIAITMSDGETASGGRG